MAALTGTRASFAASQALRPSRCSRTAVRAEASNAVAEKKERKLSPLERGGTLSGEQAVGKDAGAAALAAISSSSASATNQIVDGRFKDDRWVAGRWDLQHATFKGADGEIDWDKVIDAEMARRKLLEETPIASRNDDPVLFDTSEIPWWAWVRRFHLPEAEKLNGRAAMLGYVAALFVDQLTGAGLLDQQNSFFGKILLILTIVGVLAIRENADVQKYKNLFDEATFYDKQWNATWEGQKRPSETEQ